MEMLEWFNYLRARVHPGCEAARVYCTVTSFFVEVSPIVEKAVSCYKADGLAASLPNFHSIQSSLAVLKFRVAGKERCKRGHGQVCANL